jgi:hypothetical protein
MKAASSVLAFLGNRNERDCEGGSLCPLAGSPTIPDGGSCHFLLAQDNGSLHPDSAKTASFTVGLSAVLWDCVAGCSERPKGNSLPSA